MAASRDPITGALAKLKDEFERLGAPFQLSCGKAPVGPDACIDDGVQLLSRVWGDNVTPTERPARVVALFNDCAYRFVSICCRVPLHGICPFACPDVAAAHCLRRLLPCLDVSSDNALTPFLATCDDACVAKARQGVHVEIHGTCKYLCCCVCYHSQGRRRWHESRVHNSSV